LIVLRKSFFFEGMRGFYKGLASPVFGAMAENAVLFSVYGQSKKFLQGKKSEASMLNCVAAGSFTGIFVAFVLTPVELIKCRLQVQVTNEAKYKGPIDCIRKIVREEGAVGLYRGLTATLSREIIGNAAWFGVYELGCRLLTPKGKTKDDLNLISLMTAGACAGMVYWALPYPADAIKSVLQTIEPAKTREIAARYRNLKLIHGNPLEKIELTFSEVGRYIYQTKGIRGFYQGLSITLCRAAPTNATIFSTYELLSRAFKGQEKS